MCLLCIYFYTTNLTDDKGNIALFCPPGRITHGMLPSQNALSLLLAGSLPNNKERRKPTVTSRFPLSGRQPAKERNVAI